MENIIFRAFLKEEKMMCDVAAINFYMGNVVLLARDTTQVEYFTRKNKEVFINDLYNRLSVSKDSVEVMPYVGINDINNKLIFVGDIIKCNFYGKKEVIGVVDIDCGCAYLKWSSVSDNQLFAFENLEVIGNIYENPELLNLN